MESATERHHQACKKLLDDTAQKLGLTPKQVCQTASPSAGLKAFQDFELTGLIPSWLEAHCIDVMLKPRKRAENLLGGLETRIANGSIHHSVMGLSAEDLEADAQA